MLVQAVRVAEGQGSCIPLLQACLSLLELSSRHRLRAIVLARATRTLKRLQRSSSGPELDRLQERLEAAAVGVGRV